MKGIKRKLRKIKKENDGIKSIVAKEALMCGSPKHFFRDLSNYGCVSGMIGSLVWYSDTRDFYDEHYFEIEEIREEWEDSVGESIRVNGDMKNFFAWFAFEEVAYKLSIELGYEI